MGRPTINDTEWAGVVSRHWDQMHAAQAGDAGAYGILENDFNVPGARFTDIFDLTPKQMGDFNWQKSEWDKVKAIIAAKPDDDPTKIVSTPGGTPPNPPTDDTMKKVSDVVDTGNALKWIIIVALLAVLFVFIFVYFNS